VTTAVLAPALSREAVADAVHVGEVAADDMATPGSQATAPAASPPRWIQQVSLSRDPQGPKLRLGRSERFQQMVIQFDEKPTDESRSQLGDAGWRWRPAEGQWTKQLDADSRARSQLHAEQLFDSLVHSERQERGLPTLASSLGR